jgi:hypothetical protein
LDPPELAAVIGLVTLVAACGGESKAPILFEPRGCTELGCENGVNVDFTFRERGRYVFVATVDGATTTCRATLPLPKAFFEACDRSEVFLGLVGAQLPADQQSIEGLKLPAATNATSITVEATRDGISIGQKTFKPPYDVRPGPNGPDCEPKECKLAQTTFP